MILICIRLQFSILSIFFPTQTQLIFRWKFNDVDLSCKPYEKFWKFIHWFRKLKCFTINHRDDLKEKTVIGFVVVVGVWSREKFTIFISKRNHCFSCFFFTFHFTCLLNIKLTELSRSFFCWDTSRSAFELGFEFEWIDF